MPQAGAYDLQVDYRTTAERAAVTPLLDQMITHANLAVSKDIPLPRNAGG